MKDYVAQKSTGTEYQVTKRALQESRQGKAQHSGSRNDGNGNCGSIDSARGPAEEQTTGTDSGSNGFNVPFLFTQDLPLSPHSALCFTLLTLFFLLQIKASFHGLTGNNRR